MRSSVPALLGVVVMLVLAAPALALTAAGPTASTAETNDTAHPTTATETSQTNDHLVTNDTTNRLTLDRDGANASAIATPRPDLGTILAGEDTALEYEFDWHRFDGSFDDLNQSEREAAGQATMDAIADRFAELQEREAAVVEAHANGEASEDDLFRTLARNTAEAEALLEAADRTIDRAELVPEHRTDFYSVKEDLYTGSIREAIAAGVAGEEVDEIGTVTVETSETGLLLSAIDDGEYVREATRYDNRDRGGTDQIGGLSSALDTAAEYYPWAFEDSSSQRSALAPPLQLYRIGVSPSQGEVTAYLDGATASVYHEQQRLALSTLPINSETTESTGWINVSLERTPAGGPALVSATDTTGSSVDATVSVDGVEIAQTGIDGTAWIAPPMDAEEVTVEGYGEKITMPLDAADGNGAGDD
ncbi:hypothetical protein OB905_10635 [Halobacteria archaeon AArc-dxtr1]|nr:hypothetical protein [Halobacteria archaeon AArc-dxtr1]